MGQRTPNMSIYKPATAEEAYGPSFASGLDNIDGHDHTGGPNKGKRLGTDSILDGAITPEKLSNEILAEAILETTGATPAEIVSIPMAESSGIMIQGKLFALRDNTTECAWGTFEAGFRRPTAGSVTAVGANIVNIVDDSSGAPNFQLVADTTNEAVSLQCIGEAGKNFDWHITYNVVQQPEP